ncbi:OsmC family protein [Aeromicrobium fastidiosum]|uniref:OsmC family protein n=1 Tax=Aeromicrobium fastidiosum TaxID=52699 RepID=A0A641AQ52_9ACTN|nr:OsmC family protein [Aeromicrobium fastidiosum]KAA1379802.1 OsmC family protein [Aeromicrobium fastidiosum]MBP2389294.1 putative OsmC-like protein [Aeromicrobium fastidiosum]
MTQQSKQTVPFVVDASGTGVIQDLVVAGDNRHDFRSDTYPAFGGTDASPSPLVYALGALTSCNQITAQLVAKDLGVTLGAFTFAAQGDLDPSVLVGGAEGNANFDAVSITASVQTDADEATFATLVSELERRCPVTQLFKRSGLDYTSTWSALPLEAAS